MVVGTKTSGAGLTTITQKDDLTGSWMLEAGSLVLMDGGMLVIDEIDKMKEDHHDSLLEPMSAGTVTTNKANIFATLPARTSILAVANPIFGNFDYNTPLIKQIQIKTA